MPPLLIPHVEESRLSALQLRLESISQLSIDFLVLLACSTVIATFGLFQNSAAVIIGALVFFVMGFTPLTQAKKGLAISALVATFLVVPLGFSMRELILENQISASIKTLLKEKTVTFRDVQLHDVKVKKFRTPMSVIATVLTSDETINSHQVRLVQDFLSREMGSPVEFRLRIIPSTELSAAEVGSESPASSITSIPLTQKEAIIAPDQEKSTQPEEQPSLDRAKIVDEPGQPVTDEPSHATNPTSADLMKANQAPAVDNTGLDH